MRLLTEIDLEWLRATYPLLQVNEQRTELFGMLSFTAGYDAATGLFTIARLEGEEPSGMVLSGAYDVRIKDIGELNDNRWCLPRLFIESTRIPFGPGRHFNGDNSACLCGPSEEMALLGQGYIFPRYLEEVCIPFLYGQVHFDAYQRWPWPEYDHDIVGVLQSYAASGSTKGLGFVLWGYLSRQPTWPVIRSILANEKRPKGHMPCLCQSRTPIRHCHPDAWEGLKKLCADVRTSKTFLPH
jgi:hypothetical protein